MNFLAHAVLAGGEAEFVAAAAGFGEDFRAWLGDTRGFVERWREQQPLLDRRPECPRKQPLEKPEPFG